MKNTVYLTIVAALLLAVALPAALPASAQQPGGATTSPVPMEVPADWSVYQDPGGSWWLKHPPAWTVEASVPGEVDFKFDTVSTLNLVIESGDPFPIPFDNWLALDLIAQGVSQSMAEEADMDLMEMGRWFRGVFGLFFALETVEPTTGMTIPVVVVVFPLGDDMTVRATFSVFSVDDKNTVGAVLSSISAGPAPAAPGGGTSQPQTGGAGFFGADETPTVPPVPTVAPVAGGPAFGPIVFAENLDAQNQPVNPTSTFASGVEAVYAIFDYSGMQDGTSYTTNWYMNGTMVFSDDYTWDLGVQGSGASVLLSNPSGFPDGQYGLELLVGGNVVQQGAFSVGGAVSLAITPPSTLAQPTPLTLPTPALLTQPTPMVLVETPVVLSQPTPFTPADTPTPVPPPPTPEPKGRAAQGKIVYTQFDGTVPGLWIMNLDGSGTTQIKDGHYASDPSWSPNGTSIVFEGWDGNPRGGSGIYTMNADGSNVKQIWNQGSASYLDWSLPGRYVLLTAIVAGTENKRLIVYDGKDGQWMDIGPGEQGSFAPDADRLVAKSCIGGDCGLYIMNRDGGNKWRLTTGGNDSMAAWSPTGDKIAYASERDGNWDIWIINPDGSGDTRLTSDPGIDALPAWLPDGSGIVFRSSRGGSWGIWIMDADGGNPAKLNDSFAGNDWGRARLDVN